MTNVAERFLDISMEIANSAESAAILVLAETIQDLASAHREHAKTIEEGIMYLVRNQ